MNGNHIKKLLVATLIFLPVMSMALPVSQSFIVNFDMPGAEQSLNKVDSDSQYLYERLIFPAFDPTLGTLLDFNLELNLNISTNVSVKANDKRYCIKPPVTFGGGCGLTASASATLDQTFYGDLIFGGENLDPLSFLGDSYTFNNSVDCTGNGRTYSYNTYVSADCNKSRRFNTSLSASVSFDDVLNAENTYGADISELAGNTIEMLLGRQSVLDLTKCQGKNCSAVKDSEASADNVYMSYSQFGDVTLSYIYEPNVVASVAEPGTVALFGMGMIGLVSLRRRQQKQAQEE